MKIDNMHKNIYYTLLAAQLTAGVVSVAQVIEEDVVTAQKREHSLQSMPVSVSALTGYAIEKLKMEFAA